MSIKLTLVPRHPPSKGQLTAATVLTATALLAVGVWTQTTMGDRLLPHAFCISASQPLLLLHLISDGLIALAYMLIPWAMLSFTHKRRDLPFGWVAWAFGAFIVACGITHAMEMWTLWYPVYWYAGVAKAFTAVVSLGAAWLLYMLTPEALALPSAQNLSDANASLRAEIAQREQAQRELAQAKLQVEELLARSNEKAQEMAAVLDKFFEVAPLGLALLDQDKRYLRVNPALASSSGRPIDEYVGRKVDELAGIPEKIIEAVNEVWSTGEAQMNVAFQREFPDEGVRAWRGSYFPIQIGQERPMIGAILQEVTYQLRIERQREEALASAEEASRAKDEFLAKVSHELRSPLQVALSSAEVLKRLPDVTPQARKFVDRLGHAISLQARMINDLLDLSRILSGKLHIESKLVDPALPLLRVLEHWKNVATERKLTINVDGVEPGGAMVEADPDRLQQVYANLIDNGIRFSPEGGVVVVTSVTESAKWRFVVRDSGVGLEPEEIAGLFRPFSQGSVQPKTGKGLGLGLAIVSNLAEAFGGRVWVESAGRHRGATFIFELPLASVESARLQQEDEDVSPSPRLDALRLLYVEDEEEVVFAMRDGLEALGAHVEVATGYVQALSAAQSGSFDAIVTDLNLGPGPGGRDLAEALRGRHGQLPIPVIGVSAFGTKEDLETTRRTGFAAHLVKPVTVDEVAGALRAVCRPRR